MSTETTLAALDWRQIKLAGSQLIEASAGTGKTFTIGLIVLRLVLEGDCRMSRIALVTFTVPAASELAERMGGFLAKAASIAEGQVASEPGDPIAEAVNQACRGYGLPEAEAARTAAERLRRALLELDQARVCTINSFCANLLDEFAFELGTGTGYDTLADESPLVEEILADFWRRELAPRPDAEQPLIHDLTPAALAKRLKPVLTFPLAPIEGPELRERPAVWTELCAAWGREREAFIEFITNDDGINRKSINKNWLPEWLPRIEETFDPALEAFPAPEDDLATGKTVGEVVVRLSRARFENGTTMKPDTVLPPLEIFDLADAWIGHPAELEAALVTKAARWLRGELARRKAERRQRSFADQIAAVAEGLERGDPRCAEAIRARFSAVLVDEFQDTDLQQFTIFNTLFGNREDLFFAMIGDPKQAIYRFRGGDIAAYLAARRGIARERCHTLSTNYRSQARLIEALNRIYRRCERPGGPFRSDAIGWLPASAGAQLAPAARSGAILPPVTLWVVPEDATSSDAAMAIARRIIREIHALTDPDRPTHIGPATERRVVKTSDIAILVSGNATGAQLKRHLAEAGIRSVLARMDSVLGSPEADGVEQALACLAEPADEGRMRALLMGPLFNRDLAWTDAWAADDRRRLADAAEQAELHRLWQRRGVAAALDAFFRSRGLFTPRGETGAAALARDRRITNLRHLMELLHDEDVRLGRLPARTLRRYRQLRAEATAESHEQRLESDGAAVQILTMHKSKGLQWPVVFAAELTKDGLFGAPLPLLRDAAGRPRLSFHPDDAAAIAATDREEILAERQRLAYVALTRAESLLFAVAGGQNEDSPARWLLDPGQLTGLADEQGILVDHQPLEDGLDPPVPRQAPPGPLDLSRLRSLPPDFAPRRRWNIGSYSGLTRAIHGSRAPLPGEASATGAVAPPVRAAAPAGIFAFPRGAEPGTALHAVLEKVDFQDADSWPARAAAVLAEAGYTDAAHTAAVVDMLGAVLNAPLIPDAPDFRLSLLDRAERAAELEFHLSAAHPDRAAPVPPLDAVRLAAALPAECVRIDPRVTLAGWLTGTIDLVFRWDGRWYILDWKSNHLGDRPDDYSPDRLAEAMDEANYHLQYLFYAVALGRHLRQALPGGYDFDRDFGGVIYVFLRGTDGSHSPDGRLNGVFFRRPPPAVVAALEELIP